MSIPPNAWISTAPLGQVTHAQFAVYCALRAYANKDSDEARPMVSTVAAALGMSDRTVREHMAALREAGFIARAKRGGLWVTSFPDPTTGGSSAGAVLPQVRTSRRSTGGSSAGQPAVLPQVRNNTKNNTKNNTIQPRVSRQRTHEDLPSLLSDTRADGKTWAEHWREKFPELDGKAHRPTVADAAAVAWDHTARRKRTDMPRYVENWLREEARRMRWQWQREQTETESDGDRVLRALREEMARD